MIDSEFGAKLRAIRVAAGKSVSDISAYLREKGVKASEKTIYSWEAGRSQPTPDTLLEMCTFYGVDDILVAFGYKKEKPTSENTSELTENETIFLSLPTELRQEALRYMRYLAEQEDKQ
jgi:transcriptional regulator with XRE-family HTH domain